MKRHRYLFLYGAALLVVSACASTPPTTSDEAATSEGDETNESDYGFEYVEAQLEGLDQDERWEKLIELAEAEEGTFMVYLSVSAEDSEIFMEGFETAIDSDQIDFDYYRAGGESLTQRIVQEHDADRPQNDVVFQSASSLDRLDREGLLQTFDTPLRDLVREDAQEEYGIGVYINVSVPTWNTESVPDGAEIFDTWLDVVTYDGVIGVELEGHIPFANLAWYFEEEFGMSHEETTQLFADATLAPVEGLTALAEFTAAGQADVSIGLYSHHHVGRLEDAPLEFMGGPEPFFFRWNGVAPMASSDMPATTLLFIDYAVSEPGQEIMLTFGREPANSSVGRATPEIYDYEWRQYDDIRVNEEREYWGELWYDRVLGQAPPAGD